jgi:NAD(P)-dependent dehydrogenase (short-subunit alcohol dehydrogenase family)
MGTWFVTGSNRGIGLGLCRALLARRERVIGACRNAEGCRDHWELARDFGELFESVQLDVTKDGDLLAVASKYHGKPIDYLVNNAGIMLEDGGPLGRVSAEALMKSFAVNTVSPIMVTQCLLPSLKLAKMPVVANISSKMGSIADNASGGHYAYRASKCALNMLAKCMKYELKNGVVLTLHPGWVQTDMGGQQAPLAIHDAVEGLIKVISRATLGDSGTFLDYTGARIDW